MTENQKRKMIVPYQNNLQADKEFYIIDTVKDGSVAIGKGKYGKHYFNKIKKEGRIKTNPQISIKEWDKMIEDIGKMTETSKHTS